MLHFFGFGLALFRLTIEGVQSDSVEHLLCVCGPQALIFPSMQGSNFAYEKC